MSELSFWGWGRADRFPGAAARRALGEQLGAVLGFEGLAAAAPARIEDVEVRASRLRPPASLSTVTTAEAQQRIRHTYGRGYRDLVRGFSGDFSPAPDLVAHPRTEQDVIQLLDWASSERVAVIPFGGGTSVVGGVEADLDGEYSGVVSLDLKGLDRVLEVERSSLSARVQAGATGPALERQLATEGLTLRHYPQSFELSTLGGWIATRASGHFATVYTHIDDLVQSTRMVTPRGVMETLRVPGSGAGPSPDRLVLGSEGTLGVITEAWMRVRPRPTHRARAALRFERWEGAVEAVRALSQSGLYPANCRLLDAREAALNRVADDGSSVLIIAFESADHALRPWMERALELAGDHGGSCPEGATFHGEGTHRAQGGEAESWKAAFFDAPYLQNIMVSLGVIADTFETAIPWERFEALHAALIHNLRDTMKRVCGGGTLTCRITHLYPDGPAPYFTFLAPARRGCELDQWAAIKSVASDTLRAHGATITHHHAVGRTHRPWYESQRPEPFGVALAAAKAALDPAGVLNPGCLLPARDA